MYNIVKVPNKVMRKLIYCYRKNMHGCHFGEHGMLEHRVVGSVFTWRKGPIRNGGRAGRLPRAKGCLTMDDLSMCAYRAASARAACEDDQSRADRALDVAVAGEPLAALGDPTVLGGGAHEPTPTPYWILDDLLGGLSFERTDHLLDVGCGAGRVLAYAAATQLPCRVTGVELDGRLAARAASWTRGRDGLEVIAGSALDIPLGAYTHFYLFNPFDQVLLVEFLDRLEAQVRRSITLVHMSDNGESFAYLGRAGWMREREGSFYEHPAGGFPVFGYPQHYSIWRYVPDANGAKGAPVV